MSREFRYAPLDWSSDKARAVAQGRRLAGLTPPAGAVDRGFGSVA